MYVENIKKNAVFLTLACGKHTKLLVHYELSTDKCGTYIVVCEFEVTTMLYEKYKFEKYKITSVPGTT